MNVVQFRTDWTNYPSGTSALGTVMMEWNPNNIAGVQRYVPFATNRMFYREFSNGTWGSWQEIPKIISGSSNAVVNANGDIAAKALSPSGLGGITSDNYQVVIMPTSDIAGTKAGHFWTTKSTGQFTVYFRNNEYGNMTPGETVPFDYIIRVK